VSELHLLLGAENGFAESNGELQAQIIAFTGPSAPGTAAHPTAAETTEEGFKEVCEAPHVAHVGHATAAQAGFTKLVIAGTGLGITQHLISTAYFFKPLLCPWVLIDIGVVLPSQASIGTLESVGISIATHPEQVIEVGHQPACS
jgi:hypothetical protein